MRNDISLRVNGLPDRRSVPGRLTLADYLREERRLTGTRLGCEQGACGACTVLLDGRSVRSCLVLAGQADGSAVVTVEGLAEIGPVGLELQAAFGRNDALQCGFCTPGLLMASLELLAQEELDEAGVRSALSGNLCRCTGYEGIVRAVLDVHERLGPVAVAPEWLAAPPMPVPATEHDCVAVSSPPAPTAAGVEAGAPARGAPQIPARPARRLLLVAVAAVAGITVVAAAVLAGKRR